jgi:peptidoglycan hydrolase CwlO-like protein
MTEETGTCDLPPEQQVCTASSDGTPATLAPVDKGAWWERWNDESTWTKETETLPSDSDPPDQIVAKAEAARAAKRKVITDANAAHDSTNQTTLADPANAKKLKKRGRAPALPSESLLDDASYNATVARYNKWVVATNHTLGGAKLATLDAVQQGARSDAEQAWADKGLSNDFWLHRIDDGCAKKIRDFRRDNIPASTLDKQLTWECRKDLRDLGEQQASLNKAIKETSTTVGHLSVAVKSLQHKKKPDPDAIDNAQTKLDQAQGDLDKLKANKAKLDAQLDTAEASHTICAYVGGMIRGASKRTIDEWETLAAAEGVAPRVGAAYFALCAGTGSGKARAPGGNPPREGTPTTVVTYDATLTFGAGFNVSTGSGWEILRDIARQPAGYEPEERLALREMWDYLKKCGVYISSANVTQSNRGRNKVALPMTAVHIVEGPGDKVRGYVLTNAILVQTGVHSGARQNHQETHGAAYEYVRHSADLLKAFIAIGKDKTVPEQQSTDAAPLSDTLAEVNFRVFCNLHKDSVRLPNLVKGRALYMMLVHYMHWGPAFAVSNMLLWAISRRLVPCKIDLTGAANVPSTFEVKGADNLTDDASAGSVLDIAGISFTPSYEIDVVLARLLGAYAMKVMSKASREQMAGYWAEFLDDLGNYDGQPDLAAKQPAYYVDSAADVKARDTVTDDDLKLSYATEIVGGKMYVLGKKRDIDEIAPFREDLEKSPLKGLLSLAQKH